MTTFLDLQVVHIGRQDYLGSGGSSATTALYLELCDLMPRLCGEGYRAAFIVRIHIGIKRRVFHSLYGFGNDLVLNRVGGFLVQRGVNLYSVYIDAYRPVIAWREFLTVEQY